MSFNPVIKWRVDIYLTICLCHLGRIYFVYTTYLFFIAFVHMPIVFKIIIIALFHIKNIPTFLHPRQLFFNPNNSNNYNYPLSHINSLLFHFSNFLYNQHDSKSLLPLLH